LSTVGLKSKPKKAPLRDGVNAGPSATAMPVDGLSRYTTLSEPTPYRSPGAGRKSIPFRDTPAGSPVIGITLRRFLGDLSRKLTRFPEPSVA
jgi:hypothetical protein